MKYKLLIIALLIVSNTAFAQVKKVWFDSDLMIGLPERAPREVDDGVTLIMALRQPSVKIVGLSLITVVDYGDEVAKKLLGWYNTGEPIPVYKGSNLANDLGTENDATRALAAALRKEKLTILALGPVTNVATVLKNHPELATQIEEIVFCAARTPDLKFMPGLQKNIVGDYNFEKDVASFTVLLNSSVPLVFSGFECSSSILLGEIDIDRLNNKNEGDKWVYDQLTPWINRAKSLFEVAGFIPYDVTVLGYLTHPAYFKYYEDIPIRIITKKNDATLGLNRPETNR